MAWYKMKRFTKMIRIRRKRKNSTKTEKLSELNDTDSEFGSDIMPTRSQVKMPSLISGSSFCCAAGQPEDYLPEARVLPPPKKRTPEAKHEVPPSKPLLRSRKKIIENPSEDTLSQISELDLKKPSQEDIKVQPLDSSRLRPPDQRSKNIPPSPQRKMSKDVPLFQKDVLESRKCGEFGKIMRKQTETRIASKEDSNSRKYNKAGSIVSCKDSGDKGKPSAANCNNSSSVSSKSSPKCNNTQSKSNTTNGSSDIFHSQDESLDNNNSLSPQMNIPNSVSNLIHPRPNVLSNNKVSSKTVTEYNGSPTIFHPKADVSDKREKYSETTNVNHPRNETSANLQDASPKHVYSPHNITSHSDLQESFDTFVSNSSKVTSNTLETPSPKDERKSSHTSLNNHTQTVRDLPISFQTPKAEEHVETHLSNNSKYDSDQLNESMSCSKANCDMMQNSNISEDFDCPCCEQIAAKSLDVIPVSDSYVLASTSCEMDSSAKDCSEHCKRKERSLKEEVQALKDELEAERVILKAQQGEERSLRKQMKGELEKETELRKIAENKLLEVINCKKNLPASNSVKERFSESKAVQTDDVLMSASENSPVIMGYESRVRRYQTYIGKLERDNLLLSNELKKLKELDGQEEVQEKISDQQCEIAVQKYEHWLDEIANRLVHALLLQKRLEEECKVLHLRVEQLEQENGALMELIGEDKNENVDKAKKDDSIKFASVNPKVQNLEPSSHTTSTSCMPKKRSISEKVSIPSESTTTEPTKSTNARILEPKFSTSAISPNSKLGCATKIPGISNPKPLVRRKKRVEVTHSVKAKQDIYSTESSSPTTIQSTKKQHQIHSKEPTLPMTQQIIENRYPTESLSNITKPMVKIQHSKQIPLLKAEKNCTSKDLKEATSLIATQLSNKNKSFKELTSPTQQINDTSSSIIQAANKIQLSSETALSTPIPTVINNNITKQQIPSKSVQNVKSPSHGISLKTKMPVVSETMECEKYKGENTKGKSIKRKRLSRNCSPVERGLKDSKQRIKNINNHWERKRIETDNGSSLYVPIKKDISENEIFCREQQVPFYKSSKTDMPSIDVVTRQQQIWNFNCEINCKVSLPENSKKIEDSINACNNELNTNKEIKYEKINKQILQCDTDSGSRAKDEGYSTMSSDLQPDSVPETVIGDSDHPTTYLVMEKEPHCISDDSVTECLDSSMCSSSDSGFGPLQLLANFKSSIEEHNERGSSTVKHCRNAQENHSNVSTVRHKEQIASVKPTIRNNLSSTQITKEKNELGYKINMSCDNYVKPLSTYESKFITPTDKFILSYLEERNILEKLDTSFQPPNVQKPKFNYSSILDYLNYVYEQLDLDVTTSHCCKLCSIIKEKMNDKFAFCPIHRNYPDNDKEVSVDEIDFCPICNYNKNENTDKSFIFCSKHHSYCDNQNNESETDTIVYSLKHNTYIEDKVENMDDDVIFCFKCHKNVEGKQKNLDDKLFFCLKHICCIDDKGKYVVDHPILCSKHRSDIDIKVETAEKSTLTEPEEEMWREKALASFIDESIWSLNSSEGDIRSKNFPLEPLLSESSLDKLISELNLNKLIVEPSINKVISEPSLNKLVPAPFPNNLISELSEENSVSNSPLKNLISECIPSVIVEKSVDENMRVDFNRTPMAEEFKYGKYKKKNRLDRVASDSILYLKDAVLELQDSMHKGLKSSKMLSSLHNASWSSTFEISPSNLKSKAPPSLEANVMNQSHLVWPSPTRSTSNSSVQSSGSVHAISDETDDVDLLQTSRKGSQDPDLSSASDAEYENLEHKDFVEQWLQNEMVKNPDKKTVVTQLESVKEIPEVTSYFVKKPSLRKSYFTAKSRPRFLSYPQTSNNFHRSPVFKNRSSSVDQETISSVESHNLKFDGITGDSMEDIEFQGVGSEAKVFNGDFYKLCAVGSARSLDYFSPIKSFDAQKNENTRLNKISAAASNSLIKCETSKSTDFRKSGSLIDAPTKCDKHKVICHEKSVISLSNGSNCDNPKPNKSSGIEKSDSSIKSKLKYDKSKPTGLVKPTRPATLALKDISPMSEHSQSKNSSMETPMLSNSIMQNQSVPMNSYELIFQSDNSQLLPSLPDEKNECSIFPEEKEKSSISAKNLQREFLISEGNKGMIASLTRKNTLSSDSPVKHKMYPTSAERLNSTSVPQESRNASDDLNKYPSKAGSKSMVSTVKKNRSHRTKKTKSPAKIVYKCSSNSKWSETQKQYDHCPSKASKEGCGTAWIHLQANPEISDPMARISFLNSLKAPTSSSSETDDAEESEDIFVIQTNSHLHKICQERRHKVKASAHNIILDGKKRSSIMGRQELFYRFGTKERDAIASFDFLKDIPSSSLETIYVDNSLSSEMYFPSQHMGSSSENITTSSSALDENAASSKILPMKNVTTTKHDSSTQYMQTSFSHNISDNHVALSNWTTLKQICREGSTSITEEHIPDNCIALSTPVQRTAMPPSTLYPAGREISKKERVSFLSPTCSLSSKLDDMSSFNRSSYTRMKLPNLWNQPLSHNMSSSTLSSQDCELLDHISLSDSCAESYSSTPDSFEEAS